MTGIWSTIYVYAYMHMHTGIQYRLNHTVDMYVLRFLITNARLISVQCHALFKRTRSTLYIVLKFESHAAECFAQRQFESDR